MELLLKSFKQNTTANLTGDTHCWKVAIVADEPEVHAVTRHALGSILIDDIPLDFIDAYHTTDGLRLFQDHPDIALAFIDVTAKDEGDCLNLIYKIRNELQNNSTRIVLCIDSPESAPEEVIIRNYDINDYRSKSDLTNAKLKTCAYSCIRSYRDIIAIDARQSVTCKIIDASDAVLLSHNLQQFGTVLMEQTMALLAIKSVEIYLVNRHQDVYQNTEHTLLATTGTAVSITHSWNESAIPPAIQKQIQTILQSKKADSEANTFIDYYNTGQNIENVLYIRIDRPLTKFERDILPLFAANVTLVFQNFIVRETEQKTQRDLLFILGDAIEQRSRESGAHMSRVSLMSEMIALEIGMPAEFAEVLRYASPLHDIGKIGIPEAILHKPGKLDPDEWEIMKTHAEIGYDLLKRSNTIIAKMGARIARTHHEFWDGNGYPRQLLGEQIPVEGRIVAITDVIDALSSTRTYKKPWNEADIRTYIRERSGRQFDPQLVEVTLNLFGVFKQIRKQLPD